MTINYDAIGKRVQQIRKHQGLSQLALSEMIERSPGYLSYLETGVRKMSLETLIALANALNTSADSLLVDSIVSTIMASNHAFADLLSDCNEYEVRVLIDIATATKQALRKHTPHVPKGYR